MMLAKLAKLKPREKVALGLLLVCALGLLVYRLVVHPVVDGFKKLDSDIAAQKERLAGSFQVLQTERQVAKEYASVTGSLGTVTTISDFSIDVNAMKGEIDELAKKSGLQLLAMDHRQPVASKDPYVEYVVQIGSFEGSAASLLSFVNGLRSLPGLVNVAKLTVTPGKSEGTVKGSMLVTKVMRTTDG